MKACCGRVLNRCTMKPPTTTDQLTHTLAHCTGKPRSHTGMQGGGVLVRVTTDKGETKTTGTTK